MLAGKISAKMIDEHNSMIHDQHLKRGSVGAKCSLAFVCSRRRVTVK